MTPSGAGSSAMLPSLTMSDTGAVPSGSAPTPYNQTPTGPFTVQETGQTFITVDRAVTLKDAFCSTSAGGTPAQQHALLIKVGNISAAAVVVYSSSIQPGAAQRHIPKVTIPKGATVYFQGVQLTGSGAEAVLWHIDLA